MKEKILNLFIVLVVGLGVVGITVYIWPQNKLKEAPTSFEVPDPSADSFQPAKKVIDIREVKKKPLELANLKDLKEPKAIDEIQQKTVQKAPMNRFPPGLQENHVYFKVIEGNFAVAFGDVILGRVPEKRKGIQDGAFEPKKPSLWPSPEIPFKIEEGVEIKPIMDAIAHFETSTPIRFVPLQPGDENGIVFIPGEEHCASQLGMVGGIQPILLSKNCGFEQVVHEIMHALGFVHEHSREERDKFINVNWDNIDEDFRSQFNIIPDHMVHNYIGSVFSFDYESIMLYPETAFAKGKSLKTLESKTSEAIRPSTTGLSQTDKDRIYYLYGY